MCLVPFKEVEPEDAGFVCASGVNNALGDDRVGENKRDSALTHLVSSLVRAPTPVYDLLRRNYNDAQPAERKCNSSPVFLYAER